jgi:hypothetical protein
VSLRASAAALVVVGVVVSPRLARACAVCMSGREDDVQFAFIATTALLSALPLIFVGGVVWWLRRRLREMEEGDAAATPAAIAD